MVFGENLRFVDVHIFFTEQDRTSIRDVIRQHCMIDSGSLIFCPKDQPTLIRGKEMEKKTLYGDGLAPEVLQYQFYIFFKQVQGLW